ncbi:sugar ABC transporter ATP-binding protein [Pseudolysinimonas sp.]|uniref:sugar ABC transporter ATP-binding protein n=1 Tax=Pseudolysinimonas sp. TaxID=2680009 RepID=UPI003F808F84
MSGDAASPGAPVLEVIDADVRFVGQVALEKASLRLFPGEVHSLMGENGAGKSTLIRAITGAQALDGGRILLRGRPVVFSRPADAVAAGIGAVYQEIELIPELSVAENVMLGDEPRRFGGIDWRATRRMADAALGDLGIRIDPASSLRSHSPAIQQLVAIARAVRTRPDVLVLDEPTSSLDQDEVAQLFAVMRALKREGVAILFISHFLEQVYEIADRLTILRNGRLVGEYLTSDILRIELVERMLGTTAATLDDLDDRDREEQGGDARVVAEATGLGRAPRIAPFDLVVREGEIVGFAGLLGSGRTDAARLLAGVDRPDRGSLRVEGRALRATSPRAAISAGAVYSSEDRKSEGIIGQLTVLENILLGLQGQLGWRHRMSRARQRELAVSYIEALGVIPADPDAAAGTLSGGNQQKVLLARWLALAPRLLILDEPTRGIDVGAKAEIQRQIVSLAENGMSVVFISAELEEVLRLSDRIVVLREREVVGVVDGEQLTPDQLLALIAQGGGDDD